MPKKKTQTPEQTQAFSQPTQQEAINPAASQSAAPAPDVTAVTTTRQETAQIPPDLAELIKSTLTVIVAQRKTHGLAITLTSLTNAVKKNLEKYLKHTPTSAVREFIRSELAAMGYQIVDALVEHKGDLYRAEVVMLYKNFDELVDMVKKGRVNNFMKSLISNEVAPPYDKIVKGRHHV
ncbi:MAG: hypothetical protein ACO2PN_15605 [Pyrobaculum sp.]|jgi:hypothetical protein